MFGSGDDSATYDVGIKLHKVGDGWDDLSAGVGKFTDAIDGVMGKLAGLGKYAIVGGIGAAIAGATYGVSHLNAEAEKAQISIGTIFSANGMASGVPQGIQLAGETIAKMRVDAQKLPGEFEDLQNIFQTGAISAFRSGASVDQWRQISAKAMAASAVSGLPMDQAARELAQLLEGRSGAHNVLGMRLMGLGGAEAQAFNKKSAEDRLKVVSTTLDKYSGSIDAFSHSWDGLTSTFIDNVKNFGRSATGPLFESVKSALSEANDWFGEHQREVNSFAMTVGTGLQHAFEWAKAEVLEWGPLAVNFVEVTWHRMQDFWADVQPYVQSFAGAMKEALSDPNGTIDKLTHLLGLYATLKGAGMGYDIGKTVLGAATFAGGKFLGAGGGAAAEAAGLSRGASTLAAEGWAEFGEETTKASTALGGLTLGATATGAVFLAAVAAWGAAIYEATDLYSELHSQTLADTKAIAEAHAGEVASAIRLGDTWEQIDTRMQDAAGDYVMNMDAVGWAMNDVAVEASAAASGLGNLAAYLGHVEAEGDKRMNAIADKAASDLMLALKSNIHGGKGSWDAAASEAAKKPPKMKGGHGGTHVQKVEIVVTSNQNPSRIARQVEARFANLRFNRRVSPDVQNFSDRDEG